MEATPLEQVSMEVMADAQIESNDNFFTGLRLTGGSITIFGTW